MLFDSSKLGKIDLDPAKLASEGFAKLRGFFAEHGKLIASDLNNILFGSVEVRAATLSTIMSSYKTLFAGLTTQFLTFKSFLMTLDLKGMIGGIASDAGALALRFKPILLALAALSAIWAMSSAKAADGATDHVASFKDIAGYVVEGIKNYFDMHPIMILPAIAGLVLGMALLQRTLAGLAGAVSILKGKASLPTFVEDMAATGYGAVGGANAVGRNGAITKSEFGENILKHPVTSLAGSTAVGLGAYAATGDAGNSLIAATVAQLVLTPLLSVAANNPKLTALVARAGIALTEVGTALSGVSFAAVTGILLTGSLVVAGVAAAGVVAVGLQKYFYNKDYTLWDSMKFGFNSLLDKFSKGSGVTAEAAYAPLLGQRTIKAGNDTLSTANLDYGGISVSQLSSGLAEKLKVADTNIGQQMAIFQEDGKALGYFSESTKHDFESLMKTHTALIAQAKAEFVETTEHLGKRMHEVAEGGWFEQATRNITSTLSGRASKFLDTVDNERLEKAKAKLEYHLQNKVSMDADITHANSNPWTRPFDLMHGVTNGAIAYGKSAIADAQDTRIGSVLLMMWPDLSKWSGNLATATKEYSKLLTAVATRKDDFANFNDKNMSSRNVDYATLVRLFDANKDRFSDSSDTASFQQWVKYNALATTAKDTMTKDSSSGRFDIGGRNKSDFTFSTKMAGLLGESLNLTSINDAASAKFQGLLSKLSKTATDAGASIEKGFTDKLKSMISIGNLSNVFDVLGKLTKMMAAASDVDIRAPLDAYRTAADKIANAAYAKDSLAGDTTAQNASQNAGTGLTGNILLAGFTEKQQAEIVALQEFTNKVSIMATAVAAAGGNKGLVENKLLQEIDSLSKQNKLITGQTDKLKSQSALEQLKG
jgi:hypothetical protein